MLGFVVGSVCLIGLVRLLRHRRGYGGGFGGGCGPRFSRHHGHHGHHGHCGGGGGGRRFRFDPRDSGRHGWDDGGGFDDDEFNGGFEGGRGNVVFLRSLFTRLETTPGQERVIVDALKELKASFLKSDAANRKSARDLGDALQGDALSMDAMGSVFASLDEGTAAIRDGAFSALTRIHEVLDGRQRQMLADLVSRGGGLADLASAV